MILIIRMITMNKKKNNWDFYKGLDLDLDMIMVENKTKNKYIDFLNHMKHMLYYL